jgi:hypothetical protein
VNLVATPWLLHLRRMASQPRAQVLHHGWGRCRFKSLVNMSLTSSRVNMRLSHVLRTTFFTVSVAQNLDKCVLSKGVFWTSATSDANSTTMRIKSVSETVHLRKCQLDLGSLNCDPFGTRRLVWTFNAVGVMKPSTRSPDYRCPF